MNGVITLNGVEKTSVSDLKFEDIGVPNTKITGAINTPHPFDSPSVLINQSGYNIIGTQYVFSSVVFKRIQIKNDVWYFEAVGII